MNNQEKIKRYEQLKIEEKKIQAELKELKPEVESAIPEDVAEVELEHGKLVWKTRPFWAFSPVVQELEDKVSERREYEIAEGIATKTEKKFIEYRQN